MVRLGSQHCNTLGRSNTMGRNCTFTVSAQLNEMSGVQQSMSSKKRLLLLDSLLDLFCYIIS